MTSGQHETGSFGIPGSHPGGGEAGAEGSGGPREPGATEGDDAFVRIEDLNLSYTTKGRVIRALKEVSLAIRRNSVVSIIGPSGCGKSTLLKVIAKLLPVSQGAMLIDGERADRVDLTGRLSFMFQQPLLLPWRTVLSNVLLPVQLLNRDPRRGQESAEQLLDAVGLTRAMHLRPNELSGGMRQRASLARALVSSPELLLMDEPFAAVDEITREGLQYQLLELRKQWSTTIVLVTHNVEEAVLLSDTVVVMSDAPGTIRHVEAVSFPAPRNAQIRGSDEFHHIADRLRSLLAQGSGL